jgi:ribosomal protein S18 acetylase RimI-like enzyme
MQEKQTMLHIRKAIPSDALECVLLRGRTRENAVSQERLASLGITPQSWASDIETNKLAGWICLDAQRMVGYCFGDVASGEVVVLALLPNYESQGLGRRLLTQVTDALFEAGHSKLFLGCSADPRVRSHGFYRHLGWVSTGAVDKNDDDVLELLWKHN